MSVTRGGSGAATGALYAGDPEIGYRGPTACSAAGITYRQLDYWARTGLVEPTVRGATGSGTQRLYSFRDILILKIIKRLLDAGISLQQIRTAVQHLYETAFQNFFLFGSASAMAWVLFAFIVGFSLLQFRLLRGYTQY